MGEAKVRRLQRGFAAKGPGFYVFDEDALPPGAGRASS